MIKYGSPGRVYVENEWYNGPRAGVADINGVPHRFRSLFDETEDEYFGTFMIWPVNKQVLDLEIEQWSIFVDWNTLYEAGQADTDSHPGNGGCNASWDEIESLHTQSRCDVPISAKRARAELVNIDRAARYAPSGPCYMMSWSLL